MKFEIRIKGYLSPRTAELFDGFSVLSEKDGETLLAGSVPDQAALHGIFKQMRDSGIPLISVNPVGHKWKYIL